MLTKGDFFDLHIPIVFSSPGGWLDESDGHSLNYLNSSNG